MAGALHLLVGDEYLVAARANALVDELVRPEDRAFCLDVVAVAADNSEAALQALSQCRASLRTPPLFAGHKLVWLRGATFLSDAGAGRGEKVKEQLSALAAELRGGLIGANSFLITAGAADKRYAFYKACHALGTIEEFAVPDKPQAAEAVTTARVEEFARKAGLRLTSDARLALLARLGTDTRRMVSEVEKLALYVGPGRAATPEDVLTCVSPSKEAVAWDLADAVGARKLDRALAVVRQLCFQRESPIGLAFGVEARLRDLLLYREALDRGWVTLGRGGLEWRPVPPEVEQCLANCFERDPRSTHPYRAKLLCEQAARFKAAELRRCQRLATAAHEQLVTSRLPPETVLELLLVRMLA